MPQPELHAPLEAIRREAELARDAGSLRGVAREVGISPMGLRNFLRGQGKLQARTLRKLNEWYALRMARGLPEGEDAARAALTILAGYHPEAERQAVIIEHLEVTERRLRAAGLAVPLWIATLRQEVQADPQWPYPPPRS
ncbi:MAG TPA: hypothetical protein VFR37_14515 [Longimicrobium sp.]|nr:hypothetical protein [Longimicrobium sp.]